MKSVFTLKSGILGICVLLITSGFAQKSKSEKNKFLEGKKYVVKFTEVKKTGVAKPVESLIIIKSGDIQCDLMEEKLTAPAMPYKVISDTTYTEEDSDVHKVHFTSDFTEEKTSYKWDATITDYEIEGTFIMMKAGVEKKRYEFAGEEKTKKK